MQMKILHDIYMIESGKMLHGLQDISLSQSKRGGCNTKLGDVTIYKLSLIPSNIVYCHGDDPNPNTCCGP